MGLEPLVMMSRGATTTRMLERIFESLEVGNRLTHGMSCALDLPLVFVIDVELQFLITSSIFQQLLVLSSTLHYSN